MERNERSSAGGGEGSGGYLMSAVVFAGLTALWALVVRDDPYYRLVDIAGVPAPLTTLIYVFVAPLFGFLLGRWRYAPRHDGGAISFAAKLIARAVHFTYAHALIVLFTVAMALDSFLGFNIDAQVKSIDDSAFDVAARFAPWLCAYLAGFNLGRAQRAWRGWQTSPKAEATAEKRLAAADAPGGKRKRGRKQRAEPVLAETAFQASEADARGDLGIAPPPIAADAPAASDVEDEPGFLPPQDFSKLRPGLNQLR